MLHRALSFFIPTLFLLIAPFAHAGPDLGYFRSFVEQIARILSLLIPALVALALVVFFWGLVKFILKAADSTARAEGRQLMIWGVIALFVIVSIWGLTALLGQILGVYNVSTITPPRVQFSP